MCHFEPSHSIISWAPAIKSEPSLFFQASGPSYPASPTLVLVFILSSINIRGFPDFNEVGFVVYGLII